MTVKLNKDGCFYTDNKGILQDQYLGICANKGEDLIKILEGGKEIIFPYCDFEDECVKCKVWHKVLK